MPLLQARLGDVISARPPPTAGCEAATVLASASFGIILSTPEHAGLTGRAGRHNLVRLIDHHQFNRVTWRPVRTTSRATGVHILRHSFCSRLAMRGAASKAIQELAGHQELSMTQRYMHLSPAVAESAIRLLEAPVLLNGDGDILETAQSTAVN